MEFNVEVDGLQLERFLASRAPVVLLQGPRGSGKSQASCRKLGLNAFVHQQPSSDGVRYRRSYVVRNTYGELGATTLKTWKMVFPEEVFGFVKGTRPYVHHIRLPEYRVDWEVIFLAMDDAADVNKLLSAEASDAWLNEFRELDRGLLKELAPVIKRYPSMAMGGNSLPQIIGDTNAPNPLHWFAYMSGQTALDPSMSQAQRLQFTKPESWEILLQPPGLLEVKNEEGDVVGYEENPDRENARFLRPRYYIELAEEHSYDKNWIDVNLRNKTATLKSGKPVFEHEYREDWHVAKQPIPVEPGVQYVICCDFGRTPAALLLQLVRGQLRVLAEWTAEGMGARAFARRVRSEIASTWLPLLGENADFTAWHQAVGDPAGDNMAEADDISPILMWQAEGFNMRPAPTNDPGVRIEAVKALLTRSAETSPTHPALWISPRCHKLVAAMGGEYRYAKLQVKGERYQDKPEKGPYSHIADALQYGCLHYGFGFEVLGGRKVGGKHRRQTHAITEDNPRGAFEGPDDDRQRFAIMDEDEFL